MTVQFQSNHDVSFIIDSGIIVHFDKKMTLQFGQNRLADDRPLSVLKSNASQEDMKLSLSRSFESHFYFQISNFYQN